jgi:hypothetical protein
MKKAATMEKDRMNWSPSGEWHVMRNSNHEGTKTRKRKTEELTTEHAENTEKNQDGKHDRSVFVFDFFRVFRFTMDPDLRTLRKSYKYCCGSSLRRHF